MGFCLMLVILVLLDATQYSRFEKHFVSQSLKGKNDVVKMLRFEQRLLKCSHKPSPPIRALR